MIDKNTINVSYDDDLDNQFSTTVNQPAHDDWVGLPFDDTPLPSVNADDLADFDDEPNCFDGTTPEESESAEETDFDFEFDMGFNPEVAANIVCRDEKMPIEEVPDITPEETEIVREVKHQAKKNRKQCTDEIDWFDENPSNAAVATPTPTANDDAEKAENEDDDFCFDEEDTKSDTKDKSKSNKKKYPDYVIVIKGENGKVEKMFIDRNKLLKHILTTNKIMVIQNRTSNLTMLYAYNNGKYTYLTDLSAERLVADYIVSVDMDLLKNSDVTDIARKLTLVANEKNIDDLDSNENIINFSNGILNIKTGVLVPHNPSILTTIQIPCNYCPELANNLTANAPVFDAYLDTLCSGDADVKKLICQYMAVALSNIKGSRLKKAMVLYGPGDTGKSKIIELLQNLLGNDHCTVCDISDLEKRFTASNLYGKRLAGCADMTFATVSEVKIFKNLTGGDQVYAEKKCKDGFNFRYDGLFLFAANNLPHFGGDKGSWVYSRFIVVPCVNVVPKEKQDRSPIDKMITEKEAIISYL